MTFDEFIKKYGLKNWDTISLFMLMNTFDKLYLEFTPEQVQEIAKAYYENADDIYNDLQEHLEESVEKLKELFAEPIKA